MPNYSVDNLRHGISQAKKNIKTFEEAIEAEEATIKKFKWMIEQVERKEDEGKKANELGKYVESILKEKKNGD